MSEVLRGKETFFSPGKVYVVASGYSSFDWQHGDMNGWAGEAANMSSLVAETWQSKSVFTLTNVTCTEENISRALQLSASRATPQDTLIVYYSGHGLKDSFTVPNEEGNKLRQYKKENYYRDVAAFPGRKILLHNCCNGFDKNIPLNSLLAAPSKESGGSYGQYFFYDLFFLINNIKHTRGTFHTFLSTLLREFYNRPYGPLTRVVWEQDPNDYMDRGKYNAEMNTGVCLLHGYQRAGVVSRLVQDGQAIDIAQRCLFETD